MRLVLFVLFVAAAGAAVYFNFVARNSYSSYRDQQLQLLRRAYDTAPHDLAQDDDRAVSKSFLEDESRRRLLSKVLPGAAVVFLAAMILLPKRRPVAPRDPEEAGRMLAAIGDPKQLLAAEGRKAARLLGVDLNAPPAVIEAALQAHLSERTPDKLVGLAPGLRQAAEQQRREYERARDLLLTNRA